MQSRKSIPNNKSVNLRNEYADMFESPRPISEEDEQVEKLDLSNDSWMINEDEEDEIEESSPLSNGLAINDIHEHQDLYVVQSNFKSSLIEQEQEHEKQVFAYNKKLFMSKYNRVYKDNLVALMNQGFLNFEENIKVLQRNQNKFEKAITQLVDLMEWAELSTSNINPKKSSRHQLKQNQ